MSPYRDGNSLIASNHELDANHAGDGVGMSDTEWSAYLDMQARLDQRTEINTAFPALKLLSDLCHTREA